MKIIAWILGIGALVFAFFYWVLRPRVNTPAQPYVRPYPIASGYGGVRYSPPYVRPTAGNSALGTYGGTIAGNVGNAILPGAGAFTSQIGTAVGNSVSAISSGHFSTQDVTNVIFPLGTVGGINSVASDAINGIGDALSSLNPF